MVVFSILLRNEEQFRTAILSLFSISVFDNSGIYNFCMNLRFCMEMG